MKRPAFQFYPADWRNDAALRMCSLAARGLWWEMICVMHTAEPYGHLVAAAQPISPEELARIVGESAKDVTKWLAELDRRKVYSVTEQGAIYSRRMVRDEIERDQWRKRQARHRDVTPDVTPEVTLPSPRCPADLLSSSSSSSSRSKTLASSDESLLAAGVVNGDAVAYIPLADRSQWGVSKDFLVELESAYPMVDGLQTLKEIRAWCVSNPQKCKTKRGVARFLNSWFAKVQNGS